MSLGDINAVLDYLNRNQQPGSGEWAFVFKLSEARQPDLKAIGYHYVIDRAGLVWCGRHVDEVGAHAQGFNAKSIGICLVGLDQFSPAQWVSLAHLVTAEVARQTGRNGPADRRDPLLPAACAAWAQQHGLRIVGHRDLPDVHKSWG